MQPNEETLAGTESASNRATALVDYLREYEVCISGMLAEVLTPDQGLDPVKHKRSRLRRLRLVIDELKALRAAETQSPVALTSNSRAHQILDEAFGDEFGASHTVPLYQRVEKLVAALHGCREVIAGAKKADAETVERFGRVAMEIDALRTERAALYKTLNEAGFCGSHIPDAVVSLVKQRDDARLSGKVVARIKELVQGYRGSANNIIESVRHLLETNKRLNEQLDRAKEALR